MTTILYDEQAIAAAEIERRRRASLLMEPHTDYQADPIRWAVDKLGVREDTLRWSIDPAYIGHIWDGTPDPLRVIFDACAAGHDTGVESATGAGKSYAAAIISLWFPACFEGGLVFTFAPKEDQLKLFIWKHIGEFFPRFKRHFPTATLTDLKLRMRGGLDESWGTQGHAVGLRAGEQVSTKASGMHAEHMLLIYEEMQGIAPQVVEAGENACTAPHNFRLGQGNPNSQLDMLHRFSTSPGVVHVRVSALDHPNVVTGNASRIPGAVSRESIDRRRTKYGVESPIYLSRILGQSPAQASNALIHLEWLKRSATRFRARQLAGLGRRVTGKGVDVANSEHGDRGAIADWYGNCLPRVRAFACPDANALGRQVALEMAAGETLAARVGVDTIGVGSGTYNELWRLKHRVQDLKASRSPLARSEKAPDGGTYEWAADGNEFRHQRDQWYWQLREDLRLDRVDIEEDPELWEELTCPTFVDEPKTIVLPKEDIRALIGRSPDKMDAAVYGNWVRERAAPRWRDAPASDQGAHDPAVQFRTKDGKPARWVGPEGEESSRDSIGYDSQLPVGI